MSLRWEQIEPLCLAIIARGTKPSLPEARPLIAAFYERQPVGGDLHVVLDDGNWQREHVQYCVDRTQCSTTKALGRVLLMLSNSQRRKL